MMECLGLIKIHSPMRADFNRVVKWLPSQNTIRAARIASEKLLSKFGGGSEKRWGACSVIKKREKGKTPNIRGLGETAIEHQNYVKGATMYPLERSAGYGVVCVVPDS